MTQSKIKGYLMILASALCFASYGVWSRIMGPDFAIFYQGWVRSALILLILLPLMVFGKHSRPIKKSDRSWFLVTMLFTLFTQVPLYYAFNHLPLGTATFIFYGLFLLTSYAVGWRFLSETITAIKILSFFLALVGLILTFGLSLNTFSLSALLLAALNGIASGGEVATSKKLTMRYSSLQITTYSWILILLTHLPLSILLGEKQLIPAFNLEWFSMIGYALSGLGGFWLVIEGFRHVDASIGGLIGLLEIVFSAALGVFLFSDALSVSVILGGAVIILAAVLPDIQALKHRKEKPVPPLPPL
jgi:drug/metabolite transporter (DMT)-like permease